MENEDDLFRRAKGTNEIFDTSVIKYTINIPIEVYAKITEICRKKHIHRSVWFRDAINRAFSTTHTTKELIDYEVMKNLGEFKLAEPRRIERLSGSASMGSDHKMHNAPGFISRLMGNSFLYNKFRMEKEEK